MTGARGRGASRRVHRDLDPTAREPPARRAPGRSGSSGASAARHVAADVEEAVVEAARA